MSNLISSKSVLSQLNGTPLNRIASIRPAEEARIIKTSTSELSTVDGCLAPYALIRVICWFAAFCFMIGLHPLIHLNFTLQSITVLSHNTEVSIAKIFFIFCDACNVQKILPIILIIGQLRAIDADASFASFTYQRSQSNCFTLDLPQ